MAFVGSAFRSLGRNLASPRLAKATLPIIDLSGLSPHSSPNHRSATLSSLVDACSTAGFFYASGHGVPPDATDAALDAARRFFDLPPEIKAGLDNRESYAFRGYIGVGRENTAGVPDLREQLEIGPEGPPMLDPSSVRPYYMRMSGPNLWPDENQCPRLRLDMVRYAAEMEGLGRRIASGLSEALWPQDCGARNRFLAMFDDPHWQMKVCRYPPAASEIGRYNGGMKGTSGVGAHSDSGFLTLLLQRPNEGGLQARLPPANQWVDIPPIPGTFVVNLGEMLQLVSKGRFRATVHRVVCNAGIGDRISVPYFFNPRLDSSVSDLVPLEDMTEAPASDTHEGKNVLMGQYGENAFKSLARSHPEVLARHHTDLALADGVVMESNAKV